MKSYTGRAAPADATSPAAVPDVPSGVEFLPPPPLPTAPPAVASIPSVPNAALAAAGVRPATPPADIAFESVWNNGLFVKSKDGNFTAHVGGTIHYDGA